MHVRKTISLVEARGYPLITNDGFLQDEAFVPVIW